MIHEAVESYFSIEYGWNFGQMGTQRGDYVAEWFAGEFESQSSNLGFTRENAFSGDSPGAFYKAYGLSFAQWEGTTDFARGFSSEPLSGWNAVKQPQSLPIPPGMSGVQFVGFDPIRELDEMAPQVYRDPTWFGNPTWWRPC